MPRSARLDAPGVLHHIMIRGIDRRNIFQNDIDRDDLIDRLCALLPETGTACYAWTLMSNRAHFLFRTGTTPVSTVMRKLLTGYAVKFNRRHKRTGHLFRNRYKSIVCREDIHLRELVRYIHLNPIRAGIVGSLGDPDRYAYCGHGVLTRNIKQPWQDVEYVLGYFGGNQRSARKAYHRYVEAGLGQGRRDEPTGGGLIRSLGGWTQAKRHGKGRQEHFKSDERILGESDFVSAVLSEAKESFERKYELKRQGYDLEKVAARVSEVFGLEKGEIFLKGKQPNRVKAGSLFCYRAVREPGVSGAEIARLPGISISGVVYCVQRGEALAKVHDYRLIK